MRKILAFGLFICLLASLVACREVEEPPLGYSAGLEYQTLPGGKCAVVGMGSCTDTEVVVPATSPDGLTVTRIDDYAFQNQADMTSITLPNTVTAVGAYAFAGCEGLTNLKLPDGTTEIGMYAFSRCTSLKQVYLGSSLTQVGDGAFHACSSLTAAYWRGDAKAWAKVNVGSGNAAMTMTGVLYFYSANRPTQPGFYWYESGGSIRIWS